MNKEEKAKAYDEITRLLSNWYKSETDIGIKDHISAIYSELKESEGERIRKALIDEIKTMNAHYSLFDGVPKDRFIAWLEQQGEKNLPSTNEHAWLYLVADVLTWKDGIGQYLDNPRVQELAKKLCNEYAQKLYNPSVISNSNNKQETDDKVEPFKVGDWIVGCNAIYQVTALNNDLQCYIAVSTNNETVKIPYYFDCGQNHMCYYHLWNIEDAKDGDVLAAHECIVLFKEIDGLNIKCHCTYHFMNNPSFYVNTLQNKSAFHPATKEQRELLFQKINEYGYKWENNQLGQFEGINDEGFVDLGLPSGTLWAKCNLGAKTETDFGYFFQWGETEKYKGLKQFNWNDYKFGSWNDLTKYNENDKKLILDNEDDPVFVATKGVFKLPTNEQLQELIDYTNHEWTSIDGVNGMKFTNKNDNTKYIFIPAAGEGYDGSHNAIGSWGYIWSDSRFKIIPSNAWRMYFNAGDVDMEGNSRCFGVPVRGVLNK